MVKNGNFTARRPSKLVAVVVPLSDRSQLTPEEEISLKHLVHYLGRYDKYFVAPESLRVDYPGFRVKRFSKRFFGNTRNYNMLMLSPKLYEAFSEYRYILVNHLDALVFSDQLTQWCEMDFDFIGAPWIKHEDAPYAGVPVLEDKVGNGGFCLKKISSILKVIYSPKYTIEPAEYWDNYSSKPKHIRFLNLPKKFLKRLKRFNGARWEMSRFRDNEELFWITRARHYYPEFRIAPLETALRFAFECVPRYCFELNDYNLPFGCHAWHRYDRDFWQPYLLKE